MSLNRELLTRIARKLGSLRDRLVFVGGSVVELYFTDPASDRVRPTTDTDAICEVTSYTAFHRLGDALRERGFRQSPEASDPPEDVVALFTNRPELVSEVLAADAKLRDWIRERTLRFFPEGRRTELVAAFLPETRSLPGLTDRVVKRLDSMGE